MDNFVDFLDRTRKLRITICIILLLALVVGFGSVVIIPTGYTGVITTMGRVEDNTLKSGTVNFKAPFVQSVYKVNNKQQTADVSGQIWGETKDKTPVYADEVQVTFQISPDKSSYLYSITSDMSGLLTANIVASAIKNAMVTLSPDEVTIRSNIEPMARDNLNTLLAEKYGEDAVYVTQVVVGQMDFEDAYNDAIQKKSIAQQTAAAQEIENSTAIKKAEADKQVAITNAEAEAEAKKIAAEAEAEANKKIAGSISNTLVEYKKIDKWDGKMPTVTGGSSIVSVGDVTGEE